ncbi:MAG: sulfatase-like hydrolase/transferase [Proteobacteria bacterium]|nr:sulfatase-like hydrolase/transferase [Pseudomonadota bacterium]MCP4918628.1 sulfatase-like hydrolase/transferase [Pseudomonadota bacterium]
MILALALACRPALTPDSEVVPTETGPETGIVHHSDDESKPDDSGPKPALEPVGHVIVLVMDGARMTESFGSGVSNTDGTEAESFMPFIRQRLWPKGALIQPGYAPGITLTGPGHCDLMIGTMTPYGNYGVDSETNDGGLYRPEYPTLIEAARAQLGADENQSMFGGNTSLLAGLTYSLYPGLGAEYGGVYELIENPDLPGQPEAEDIPVLEAFQAHLSEHEAKLIFWNLKNIDRTGHYGPPPSYPAAARTIDEPIADFWDWLQEQPEYADDTVLVLVSDHGRHDFGTEEDWRNHGDACRGCREVPMFLMGPGVVEGAVVTEPYTLFDLNATIAALAGVDMPFSTGRVIVEALEGQSAGELPSGTLEVAGPLQTVLVDGKTTVRDASEQLSDADAFAAEAPFSATSGEDTFACWRELALSSEADNLPWTPHCSRQTESGWVGIEFADKSLVSPWWNPQAEVDVDGRLWVAYVDLPTGVVARTTEPTQQVRLVRWEDGRGWEGMDNGFGDFSLATWPALALDTDQVTWVAYGTADPFSTDRTSRHVRVQKVAWKPGEDAIWNTVHLTEGYGRMERPALAVIEGAVHLAFIANDDDGTTTIGHQSSSDGGASWSDVVELDASGGVLSHVRPIWYEGAVWWAHQGTEAEVCSATPGSTATCTGTGAAALRALSVGPDGVQVTTSAGDRSWELGQL